MAKQLSSVELRFMAKELLQLADARLDKVYVEPGKAQLVFYGHGKMILSIEFPSLVLLLKEKGESAEKPSSFTMLLRKRLAGSRLRELFQMGSERVLCLRFSTADGEYLLYIELFSKGNLVLCDASGKIIGALRYERWKDRDILAGRSYDFKAKDNFSLSADEFNSVLSSSTRHNVVKALAIDMGLGGNFAEEVCLRAGIDKERALLSPDENEKLHSALSNMLGESLVPVAYVEAEKIFDASPIEMSRMKDFDRKHFETYSEALASIEKVKLPDSHEKEIEKLAALLETQKKTLESYEQEAADCQRAGELIYENYTDVASAIEAVKRKKGADKRVDVPANFISFDPKDKTFELDL